MQTFKELQISAEQKGFLGEKIGTNKILNKEIEVHDFSVNESKHYEGRSCIWLQIKYNNEFRVVFLEGKKIQEILQKIQPEQFPFRVTLIRENDWYDFV